MFQYPPYRKVDSEFYAAVQNYTFENTSEKCVKNKRCAKIEDNCDPSMAVVPNHFLTIFWPFFSHLSISKILTPLLL